MKTARHLAVSALLEVNAGGYSNIVLNNQIHKYALPAQDNAFASVLFYGVLERRLTLDHCICHYTKKPIAKLTPAVAEILRISFYQLLYMESVPASAVVNEGVKLCKDNKCTSAASFVNGVLRTFIREGIQVPPVEGTAAQKCSIAASCPLWIVELLQESYGAQAAEKILYGFLGRQTLYARVNTTRTTPQELTDFLAKQHVSCKQDEDLPNCVALWDTRSIERLRSYQSGLFHIQDKACQMAVELLAPQKGERVLDVCSAPGSKAFTIAQMMEDSGEVVACDIYPKKIELIAQGAKRLRLESIRPTLCDGTQFHKELGLFHKVLCDVPCSGLGIMGKKPEIRYKTSKELEGLPEIQYKILENSAQYLMKDGLLLYSTCTLNPKENEQVVERFLAAHADFVPVCMGEDKERGMHTILPFVADTDGFFVGLLKKI